MAFVFRAGACGNYRNFGDGRARKIAALRAALDAERDAHVETETGVAPMPVFVVWQKGGGKITDRDPRYVGVRDELVRRHKETPFGDGSMLDVDVAGIRYRVVFGGGC